MITARNGGVLIIAGLFLMIAGSFFAFPMFDYLTAQTEAERQSIFAANEGDWRAANWAWMIGSLATAVGMLIVARRLGGTPLMAGALVFAIGSAFWVVYCYLRLPDVQLSSSLLWMESAYAWLTMIGLTLIGIAFIQMNFAKWVGYINVGYAVLFLVLFLLFSSQFQQFFPPQLVQLVALATGIAALKRRPQEGAAPRT